MKKYCLGKTTFESYESVTGKCVSFRVREFTKEYLEQIWKRIRTVDCDLPNTRAFLLTPKQYCKFNKFQWDNMPVTTKWRFIASVFREYGNRTYKKSFGQHLMDLEGEHKGEHIIIVKEPINLCNKQDIEITILSRLIHELNHVNETVTNNFTQPYNEKELIKRYRQTHVEREK